MTTGAEGFQSNNLRAALRDALGGKTAELERLLSCLGAVVTAKPNFKLAAAFGVELAALPGTVAPLLRKFGSDDAAPDTDRAFLPIAAAHGWAGRLRVGREVEVAWSALAELAADERAAVRLGTRDALMTLAAQDGGMGELLARGVSWLDLEDREIRFGAAATVVEVLGEKRLFTTLRDHQGLLDYLSRLIGEIADAPRAAERSEGRRRLLVALPPTLAVVLGSGGEGVAAQAWFEAESARADHTAVRKILSDTLVKLRGPAHGHATGLIEEMRKTLEGSAKPLRDPTRLRPGSGRGKASRRTR
jgi:hypothetical protein